MSTHSSPRLENAMDREEPGRLQPMGVTKTRTRVSDFTFILGYSRVPYSSKKEQNSNICNNTETFQKRKTMLSEIDQAQVYVL